MSSKLRAQSATTSVSEPVPLPSRMEHNISFGPCAFNISIVDSATDIDMPTEAHTLIEAVRDIARLLHHEVDANTMTPTAVWGIEALASLAGALMSEYIEHKSNRE